jgi:hypothetical protein
MALSEFDYQHTFRLPRPLMEYLISTLESDEMFLVDWRVATLTMSVRWLVYVAIYRLAHGHGVHEVAKFWDVSDFLVNKASWSVLPAIVRIWKAVQIDACYPSTSEARARISSFFLNRKGCGIPNAIGCMDGVHIPVVVPTGFLTQAFYNFKHFYSLLFVHVVDNVRRHVYISGGVGGVSNDNTVLSRSALFAALKQAVPAPFHFLVDGGFPILPELLGVYEAAANAALSDAQERFNKKLSNGRVIVEMTFGVTKARFRTFYGKTGVAFHDGWGRGGATPDLMTAIEKYIAAWMAACILHNMCVTYKLSSSPALPQEDALDAEIDADGNAYTAEEQESRSEKLEARRKAAVEAASDAAQEATALAAGKKKRDDIFVAVIQNPTQVAPAAAAL